MKLIEHNGIIYGNMDQDEFELAERWASKLEPIWGAIKYATYVSEKEGTPVIGILEDWAMSQADHDLIEEEEGELVNKQEIPDEYIGY